MYSLVLLLHSWIRWGALAAGLCATFAAAGDPAGTRAARTDRAGLAFVTLVDIQLLLGLLLYLILSPFTKEALRDFGAAATAFLGYGVPVQFGTFVLVLVLSIALLRTRLLARLSGRGVPSRTDALLGRHAIVTHAIDPTVGAGRVNVAGEDWAARSGEAIAAGDRVRVVGADGIVLEVTRV